MKSEFHREVSSLKMAVVTAIFKLDFGHKILLCETPSLRQLRLPRERKLGSGATGLARTTD